MVTRLHVGVKIANPNNELSKAFRNGTLRPNIRVVSGTIRYIVPVQPNDNELVIPSVIATNNLRVYCRVDEFGQEADGEMRYCQVVAGHNYSRLTPAHANGKIHTNDRHERIRFNVNAPLLAYWEEGRVILEKYWPAIVEAKIVLRRQVVMNRAMDPAHPDLRGITDKGPRRVITALMGRINCPYPNDGSHYAR